MNKPRVLGVGNEFLDPYWAPEVDIIRPPGREPWEVEIRDLLEAHRDLLCLWSMNTGPWDSQKAQEVGTRLAEEYGLPTVWISIEDPNSFSTFIKEAKLFDYVFTSDRYCIPQYQARGASNVAWLPLACQPALHYPQPLVDDPADLVLIANHYPYPSKVRALEKLFLPAVRAGFTLALYTYKNSPWPDEMKKWIREETSCYDVAKFYSQGRVALGSNCQEYGTTMTSMRTFEVLACGKPFLAFHSEAYTELGFEMGKHFTWTLENDSPELVVELIRIMMGPGGEDIARLGREFVLENHTYAHRLAYIQRVLQGEKGLLSFTEYPT